MKNRNGFTLIELLAVVAILAILVIVALPNVMGMFNEAKESAFTTELKQVYKVAQQQWVMDSMMSTGTKVYSRCATCTGKQLQLSGRQEFDYYIEINQAGEVAKYYATDGTYQFKLEGIVQLKDIKDVTPIASISESERINIADISPTPTPPVTNTMSICVYVGDQSCMYYPYTSYSKEYLTVDKNATINTLRNAGVLDNEMAYYFFISNSEANSEIRDHWDYFDYSVWNNQLIDSTQGCYDGTTPPVC